MRLLAQSWTEKRKGLPANEFASILLALSCMDKYENGKQRSLLFPRWLTDERRGEAVAMNIYGEQDMKLFESGVATTHIREVYSYEWTDELCEKEWTY